MFDFFENYTPLVIVIIGILIILLVILSMWKKVPQDKAAVITGLKKRIITGGGGIVIPILERADYISLENIQLEIQTQDTMTSQGVPISIISYANIKVKNEETHIYTAVEQFNVNNESKTIGIIKETATNMLEGKLREIVSRMTVEDLYQDREKLGSQVQEVIATDLLEMGLEIKNFAIRDISDANGYLEALGAGRIAQVKKDADIAKAEAEKESRIQVAEAKKLGSQAELKAQTEIAKAQKEKAVQEQEYRMEQETAKAKADAAYTIQQNITLKAVTDSQMNAEVLKQQRLKDVEAEIVQIEITKEQKGIELAEKQAERAKRRLQADVIEPALAKREQEKAEADAEKYRKIAEAEAEAEANLKKGQSDAEIIRRKGEAEAEAIRIRGLAEAEAMEKKAEAYSKYNDAAMANMLIEVLPNIAEKVAAPLSQIEKIVVLDGGDSEHSGVGKVAGNVASVMTSVFETVEQMTGFDFKDVLKAQTYDAKVNKNIQISADSAAKEVLNNATESDE
jgi:flotillin